MSRISSLRVTRITGGYWLCPHSPKILSFLVSIITVTCFVRRSRAVDNGVFLENGLTIRHKDMISYLVPTASIAKKPPNPYRTLVRSYACTKTLIKGPVKVLHGQDSRCATPGHLRYVTKLIILPHVLSNDLHVNRGGYNRECVLIWKVPGAGMPTR